MIYKHLDKGERWFKEHLDELLKEHKGKWVVVYQQKLLGIYDSFEEACVEGVKASGSEEIFVAQINEDYDKPREISVNATLGLMDVRPSH